MLPQSENLAVGDILRVSNARFLVVALNGADAAGCLIIESPEQNHRADVRVPWATGLLSGLKSEAVIRCAPVVIRRARRQERTGRIDSATMRIIATQVRREMEIQARETSWRSDPER